ncbi:MAG: LuxR C-terminal-related transcriptional regulator [Deferribacteraceae bacterium]|jgi:methyl-accepting chemotaxis protein|nr:LuxR C-terminal-related transcriptional regulator [Deferribacteraceae bacterium]
MGFKTRLIIGMACVISVGIIILSFFNYISVKSKAEKDAYALYGSTIAIVAAEADAWIADFKNMGRAAVISFANGEITPESAQAFLPILRECMNAYGYDDFVIALDDNKTYVSPTQVSISGLSYVPRYYNRPWYTEPKRTGKPFIYGPLPSSEDKMQFAVSVPIFDSTGTFAGVAAIFTDFRNLAPVLQNYDTGADSRLSIIDANRTIVATPPDEEANIMKNIEAVNAGLELLVSQINDPLVSFIKYEDKGVAKLYFQQGLVGADWYVSLSIDESIVLHEANKSLRLSSLISLGILIISLVSMVLLLRVLLRPIFELRDQMSDLSNEAEQNISADNSQIIQNQLTSEGLSKSLIEQYQITIRERQVIEILIQGKTDKEISLALDIAVSTVQAHLKRIYQKTATAGRFALIALVHESNTMPDTQNANATDEALQKQAETLKSIISKFKM